MQFGRALFALALISGCASTTRTRGLVPATSTAEALATALAPRRIAIVAGVDTYDDPAFPDLRHSGHDARALAEVLESRRGGGFDQVVLLEDPTRQVLLDNLRAAASGLRRNDQVVVYFSGHGTRVPDGDEWRRFLLGSDSRPDDLETSALDLEALTHWFAGLTAQRKALIVDACFNGDGKSAVRPAHRAIGPEDDGSMGAAAVSPGEVRLFATSPGRPSIEDDKLGHGVYTYHLLEALGWGFAEADRDADGVVTAWEAHDHARGKTVEHTGGAQVPEAALRVVGTADLILAGEPGSRNKRERALVYLYPSRNHELSGVDVLVDGRTRGSLPGTLPLSPGRHHLAMTRDGVLLAEGFATFSAGHAYRADVVSRLMEGPRFGVTVQPVVVSSPPFRFAIGQGAAGMEVGIWKRDDDAPGRGQVAGLSVGWTVAPSRPLTEAGRGLGWLTLEGGWQGDWRRLRNRVTWTLSGVLIPPDYPNGRPSGAIDPTTVPEAAGWAFGATGPSYRVGWVMSEVWEAHVLARPQLAWLTLPDSRSPFVPWLTAGVGLDAVF